MLKYMYFSMESPSIELVPAHLHLDFHAGVSLFITAAAAGKTAAPGPCSRPPKILTGPLQS